MTDKLKVAVAGVGSLGQHHARIYSEMDNVELVGVFDSDPKRAAKIAAACNTRPLDSLDALADQAEAASVAVPSHKHREVAVPLIAAGVHLLVEKPIAATTADAEAMVKLAESKDLILQVGHIERFNPVMKSLEDIADHPRFIESTRLAPYPPQRHGARPRGTEVSVVLDLMIHDLEIILHLVRSKVRDLHAIGVPVLSPTEDIANVRLCFENNCVANISASRISREQVRKIRVFQESAYISLDYQKQSGRIYRNNDGKITSSKVPVAKGDCLENELSTFVDCVIRRDEPVVSGRSASEALRLAVTICEHIRQGGS